MEHLLLRYAEDSMGSLREDLLIGVEGFPGTGKSSIFVAVANETDFRECYDGRIMSTQLSEDGTLANALGYLVYIGELLGYDERRVVVELSGESELEPKVDRMVYC